MVGTIMPDELHCVDVMVSDHTTCNSAESYNGGILRGMFCAGKNRNSEVAHLFLPFFLTKTSILNQNFTNRSSKRTLDLWPRFLFLKFRIVPQLRFLTFKI